MDTPYPGEKSPFLVPYPAPAPSDQGVKPFTAVDLAPPSGPAGTRLQAPQASPFLDKDFGKDTPKPAPARAPHPQSQTALPDPLHPIPAGSLSQVFAPNASGSSSGFPFAGTPALEPKPKLPAPPVADFVPVPAASAAPAPAPLAPFVPPAPAASPIPVAVPLASAIPGMAASAPGIPATAFPVPAPVPQPAAKAPPAPASRPAPMVPPAHPAPPAASAAPATPEPSADLRASSAMRASAILRRGSASEMIPKTDLAMTDADAPEPAPLIITSGPSVDGRRVSAYLGLVSSEIVIPMDVLFRNPAPYGELHRIKAAEDELQKVKRKAFQELEARGRALGADGIIGVTLHYSQIDAVAFLCAAAGTAVKLNLGP